MPLTWIRRVTPLKVRRLIMPVTWSRPVTPLEVSHPLQVQPLAQPHGRTRD